MSKLILIALLIVTLNPLLRGENGLVADPFRQQKMTVVESVFCRYGIVLLINF